MASIYREFEVAASAEFAWQAIRDVGAVHERLARGFVAKTVLDAGVRTVTFANGFVVQEQILAVDDEHRRLAYASINGRASHHNASFQVFPAGPQSARIAWVTDLLPDDMRAPIGQMVDQGILAIRQTLGEAFRGAQAEPADKRSDARTRFIAASPAQVFAAMSDAARIARWWGPDGFASTIHEFDFRPRGKWLLTMHGPDGQDYPNESRFVRVEPGRVFEIEHLNGHHFLLTLELAPEGNGTLVSWRQTFDTVEHYERIAGFVATANEQNLDRLAAEVERAKGLT